MARDLGAFPIQTRAPRDLGAMPSTTSTPQRTDSVKVGGVSLSLGQKLTNFRNEAVAPYVARQKETAEASRLGEQTPVQTAFQTGGNIIGAGLAPVVAGAGEALKATAPILSKVPGAGIVGGIATGMGKAYDWTVDKASDVLSTPLGMKIIGEKKQPWERDLEALNEYLQVIPVGKGTKVASVALEKAEAIKKVADIAKAKTEIEKVAGMVAQGKKADIPAVVKTLSSVDTEGVKTYADLTKKLDDKSTSLISALDENLAKDTRIIPLKDATLTEKVASRAGDVEVKHNFVLDALKQLDELYTKSNDPVSKKKIELLFEKANTEGLTVKEMNQLARKYGSEFSEKAFGKTGEPLTSVSAQSFENTRSGIKDTARQFFGDESFKAVDEEISKVIKTKDLVKRVDEAANKLKQRVTERSLGAKAGRAVFMAIDALSGGSIGGLVRAAIIPRGAGLKVMNALDIEASLGANLDRIKELQKIIDGTPDENMLIKKLNEFNAKIHAMPNKEGGFANPGANVFAKGDDALIQEAKKYATPEEFVKAQGTPVYHGGSLTGEINLNKSNFNKTFYISDSADYAKSFGGNKSVVSELRLSPEAKLADMRKPDQSLISQLVEKIKTKEAKNKPYSDKNFSFYPYSTTDVIAGISQGKAHFAELPQIKEILRELGYDGQITAEVPYAKNIGIWNKDVIKTRSQLTDIWKKANGGADDLFEQAKNFKSAEEFVRAQVDKRFVEDGFADYHQAPRADKTPVTKRMEDGGDFSLSEVVKGKSTAPDDYFDKKVGARYYSYDNLEGRQSETAIDNVRRALANGKDDVTITAYRAVPDNVKTDKLQNGDWVSFSEEYATQHGERRFDGKYKIIKQEVKPDEVWWDVNDINEWGYDNGKGGHRMTRDAFESQLTDIWKKAQETP